MNVPNRLTLIRMVIAPVYLLFMFLPLPHRFLWALIIFAAGAITDALDGRIARKYNQITVFGKLLDPVADKMLTTAALLAFLKLGWCSVWIVMIVLTREFAVTSVRLIASAQGVVIPANIWGKLKTVSQLVFIVVILILAELEESRSIFANASLSLAEVSNILLWITAALAVISGVIYCVKSRKLIDFSK
ncbi:MAG: CDP-diacylglycerol--glycerol-3-phosphate 3-phosphatidyltransferase [Clostridiales bacterium]|nr:CDP-diacylglycerol--glycerol-3-phosphate 3-phosphatidyltransferase [Clostridiales bacterium]